MAENDEEQEEEHHKHREDNHTPVGEPGVVSQGPVQGRVASFAGRRAGGVQSVHLVHKRSDVVTHSVGSSGRCGRGCHRSARVEGEQRQRLEVLSGALWTAYWSESGGAWAGSEPASLCERRRPTGGASVRPGWFTPMRRERALGRRRSGREGVAGAWVWTGRAEGGAAGGMVGTGAA